MNIVIIDRIAHPKGILFSFDKKGKQVKILFLTHTMDRMTKWKLTPEIVGETLLAPEEVLVGHYNRFKKSGVTSCIVNSGGFFVVAPTIQAPEFLVDTILEGNGGRCYESALLWYKKQAG